MHLQKHVNVFIRKEKNGIVNLTRTIAMNITVKNKSFCFT